MQKIALLAGALMLSGCGAAPGPDKTASANLANTQWVLTGFESSVGVNNLPAYYFTLNFQAGQQIDGLISCHALAGTYSQTDNLISIKSAVNSKPSTCVSKPEDIQYINQLNAVKSLTATQKTLALVLSDGSRLNFIKKATRCATPKAVSGNSSASNFNTVEITAWNTPIEDLIAQYEKTRPDFVLQSASDSCTNSVLAAVNLNTLLELQCDPGVAQLTYKNPQ